MASWILRCLDLDVDIEGTRNDAYQPGPKKMQKTKNFFKLRRSCGSRQWVCHCTWGVLEFFGFFWGWGFFWFNDSFLSLPISLHQQIVFSSKTPFVTRDLLDKLSRQILVMENIAEISTENLGNITSLTDGKSYGGFLLTRVGLACVSAEIIAVQSLPVVQEMPLQ